MSIIIEAPYIAALKEEYLSRRCSACFKVARNPCPNCKIMVYCNDTCQTNDKLYHKFECESYRVNWGKKQFTESVIVRMIVRVISRLTLDKGEPQEDLCSNISNNIKRRSWSDLLAHRDELCRSNRHWKEWTKTKDQFQFLFNDNFNDIDVFEIFGKILINRFRVGIFENILNGRIAVGWAIYLTTSRFNHCCQPDLLQCSYDINMRLKFSNENSKIPETTSEFNRLTVSYRHQNDFRLTKPSSYVPTRRERRDFVSFFFFNCHCRMCDDDLHNRYAESATSRTCDLCGDFLVLQDDFNQSEGSILTCLGRRKCSNVHKVIDRIKIPFIHRDEPSIDVYEEKLETIEDVLHPQSILLLQQREKVFFTYQMLLREDNLNDKQRMSFVKRSIQLGEHLIQSYSFHLVKSSIYPKILLTDLAQLYRLADKYDRANELYSKAWALWKLDYEDYLSHEHITTLCAENFTSSNRSDLFL